MSGCPKCWETPCKCDYGYLHCDEADCKDVIKGANNQLTRLNEAKHTKASNCTMKEFDAVVVKISAVRMGGTIYRTDHLLAKPIVHLGENEISSLSGTVWITREGDNILLANANPLAMNHNTVRWEVLYYKGEVSVCIEGTGLVESAFATLTPTKVYYPEQN